MWNADKSQGALHSRGQYILFADADGATRFSDLDMLMAAMEETEKDGMGMVVGSRAHLVSSDAVVKVRAVSRLPHQTRYIELNGW